MDNTPSHKRGFFMDKKYTSKGTPKKIESVAALTDKVTKAKSIMLADYRGLKHKQLEELRKLLKKTDSEFMIAKNRLMKRALGEKAKTIETFLNEPTAALFAYADEVAPLKALLAYFKAAGVGKTKGGLLGTTALSDSDVTRLSVLPTHTVLLGNLARQLNAPIQSFHYALQW